MLIDRQTDRERDRQTDTGANITSLTEVTPMNEGSRKRATVNDYW